MDIHAAVDEMRAILIGYAKRRQTITYSELAPMISSASLHHRAPIFHKMLDIMSREDADQGMPSLASLVVRKDSGIPGMGYFAIGGHEGPVTEDFEAYWRRQFEELCDYWADA